MGKGFDLEYTLQIYKDHTVPNGRWAYQLNTNLFGAKIKIAINKKFNSAIEGFMAYYGFKESDKECESSNIYEWSCIGVDLESVMQLLVEQLTAIIEGKRYFVVTFSGLAQEALTNLPDTDKLEKDYVNMISDGIGVTFLTVFIYKESEDE